MENYREKIAGVRQKQQTLRELLDELGRLVYRSKILLDRTPSLGGMVTDQEAWKRGRGLWKGRITEDPLQYQRRLRAEEGV